MVAAGSRRTIVRVIEEATCVWFEEPVADEKRRRLIKWKRCVLSIASGTSIEGSVALFNPVARYICCQLVERCGGCVLSIASGTSIEGSVALFNPVARYICCQLVERCGVVLFSWNGVIFYVP
ncbi:hypothetical protein F511_03858 [Dorcoceras hygrometricum]|nr:hypothetical protein F511_03858 [Dorcoceras hygrometricum]